MRYLVSASVHVNSALWSVSMQCDLCMCTCEQCPVSNVICACVRPAMGRRAGSASAPSAVTAGAHFCTSAICIGAIGSQPSELHHTQIALLHFLICQHICTDGMIAFSNFSVSINIEVAGKKVAWGEPSQVIYGMVDWNDHN